MTIVYLPRNGPINWMEELIHGHMNKDNINNGMISSYCKSNSESTEMLTFYKWIFTLTMRAFSTTHQQHGLRILHNVMRMHYVKVWVRGDAGFSLCGGLVKTTKSLSAF